MRSTRQELELKISLLVLTFRFCVVGEGEASSRHFAFSVCQVL